MLHILILSVLCSVSPCMLLHFLSLSHIFSLCDTNKSDKVLGKLISFQFRWLVHFVRIKGGIKKLSPQRFHYCDVRSSQLKSEHLFLSQKKKKNSSNNNTFSTNYVGVRLIGDSSALL